jgi:hypothetical protein
MWRSPTARSSSARWSRPDEAEPAVELAAFDGGAVLRGGGLLLLPFVLANVVRLSTLHSPGGCVAGACNCGLQAHEHVTCASHIAQYCSRDVSRARLTRRHAPSGVPSTAVDVPVRAGASCTHAHCASVVLSRKCGPSYLACAVCQWLPRFSCCRRLRPRCDVCVIPI